MRDSIEKVTLPLGGMSPTFIGSWIIKPFTKCDDLISYFEINKSKQKQGITTGGLNRERKNSRDITIHPNELELPGNAVFEIYFRKLFACYEQYATEWPFLATFADELQIGGFKLQRYESGQHFQETHAERCSLETLHRVFAWMTYLNDVDITAGGSTSFSHYGIEVQPSKGLTLIWPAEWTHAHSGNLIKTGSKYIITGWMHFPINPPRSKLKT